MGTGIPVTTYITVATALPAGDNNIGNVDIVTLPALPAGTNNIGDVDVLTLPALPAGTNNIGDVDVLTLPALPAGTNNIGDVDIASIAAGDNNIGNVDVLTLPALPAGTNNIGDVDVLTLPGSLIGIAEDTASANGDVGLPLLAIRKATPANTSGTDGDYEMLQVSAGRVWASTTIDAALPAGTNNIGDVDVLTLPALPAGTNNIGDVDVLTLPALPAGTNNIGDVDVLTQPARARTTDSIAVGLQTDAIMNSTTALTPKFKTIACASSGNNSLVAAVASKKIRVLAMAVVSSAANNVYVVDGAGSPVALMGDSTNKVQLAANSGFVLPFNPVGWFETSTTNVAVNLNLSSASAVGGTLVYVEV